MLLALESILVHKCYDAFLKYLLIKDLTCEVKELVEDTEYVIVKTVAHILHKVLKKLKEHLLHVLELLLCFREGLH